MEPALSVAGGEVSSRSEVHARKAAVIAEQIVEIADQLPEVAAGRQRRLQRIGVEPALLLRRGAAADAVLRLEQRLNACRATSCERHIMVSVTRASQRSIAA
jgi:hypothetical protein